MTIERGIRESWGEDSRGKRRERRIQNQVGGYRILKKRGPKEAPCKVAFCWTRTFLAIWLIQGLSSSAISFEYAISVD